MSVPPWTGMASCNSVTWYVRQSECLSGIPPRTKPSGAGRKAGKEHRIELTDEQCQTQATRERDFNKLGSSKKNK